VVRQLGEDAAHDARESRGGHGVAHGQEPPHGVGCPVSAGPPQARFWLAAKSTARIIVAASEITWEEKTMPLNWPADTQNADLETYSNIAPSYQNAQAQMSITPSTVLTQLASMAGSANQPNLQTQLNNWNKSTSMTDDMYYRNCNRLAIAASYAALQDWVNCQSTINGLEQQPEL